MLIVISLQETIASTNITRNQYATASDQALRHMIDFAHSLGMRVMLRPQVRLSNDPSHSWIQIGTAFSSEAQWQEWFTSYREHINYYATFAQEAGVDLLVIGDELSSTTHRESDWRRTIAEVRERYKGSITYSSIGSLPSAPLPLGDEKRIMWWDAVDYIGVDVYIPLTNKNDPTVEELKAAWMQKGYLTLLESLSNRFNKPIIFTEVGYQSKDGANKNPGNFKFWLEAPDDLQEQADCYQATLEVLWGKPWLAGMFWWQVSAVGLTWAENPLGKPAEEVIKKFYLSP
ncbi:MAG: hypothetical protein HY663_03405 [Chloroflexi bacterium]|nr:hypothetical protein [Chloroflexota bacterium]